MRRIAGVLSIVFVLAACGDTGGSQGGSSAQTSAPASAVAASVAPDFTLTLADGGIFRLSDERKPVYMVFWAEW